ncbi:MAG: LysM peptidoglycan-binding domain-containing protein [Thermomicrobiales bacterium]
MRADAWRDRPVRAAGLAVLCLVLLLLGAGCSRGADDPDPTPTPNDRFVIVTPTPGTPAPTTPTPVTGEQTYVVQPGDSLSSIASEFGVTQEALRAANGIEDPNSIYVGQQLIIPAG